MAGPEPPVLGFATPEAFEAWVAAQPVDDQPGVWVKFAKKGTGVASITYAQALDVALCHGWIDGQAKRYDETFYLQRFTPRRARSVWSRINVGHVARLTEEGRMRPEGLRQVEAAKADGRWEAAYAPQSAGELPPDLQAALDADPEAARAFAALNKVNRYAICHRVQLPAKRPGTREARIAKYLQMLRDGERLHP